MRNERREPGNRPFPWRCPKCMAREVWPDEISYRTEVSHDGRVYDVDVPKLSVPKCRSCGEVLFGDDADSQITAALRLQLGLMPGAQIRALRKSLQITQRQLAEFVGVAEASLSRWESGAQLQSRAIDNLLRLYLEFEPARLALNARGKGVERAAWPSLSCQIAECGVSPESWSGTFPRVAIMFPIEAVIERSEEIRESHQLLPMGKE
jgi:putative zinc finger/helix-turn-helix YgiT family protein